MELLASLDAYDLCLLSFLIGLIIGYFMSILVVFRLFRRQRKNIGSENEKNLQNQLAITQDQLDARQDRIEILENYYLAEAKKSEKLELEVEKLRDEKLNAWGVPKKL